MTISTKNHYAPQLVNTRQGQANSTIAVCRLKVDDPPMDVYYTMKAKYNKIARTYFVFGNLAEIGCLGRKNWKKKDHPLSTNNFLLFQSMRCTRFIFIVSILLSVYVFSSVVLLLKRDFDLDSVLVCILLYDDA